MSRKFFGTDGVRGRFGDAVINPEFISRLASGAARFAGGNFETAPLVVIGRDTRSSGNALEDAVAAGFSAEGWRVARLGIVPTPAVSLAVRTAGAKMGVSITASHNPASDNGVKFFDALGGKLSDAQEEQIEKLIPEKITPAAERSVAIDAAVGYIQTAVSQLSSNAIKGWRIAVDTANGATCRTTPETLRRLGAEVFVIGNSPNGENINADVGSEHPQNLAKLVQTSGAKLGIAHDGDGDRVIFCDETGSVLNGDEVMTFLAKDLISRKMLPHNLLVVTQQSNLGVDAALRAVGGRVVRTNIGDRYVSEALVREHGALGGESSGHIIFPAISPTGDGLIAALHVLGAMAASGQPLSILRKELTLFPQRTVSLRVVEKKPLELLPTLSATLAEAEQAFDGYGRTFVRYSGTEAKVRVLVEGRDEAIVTEWVELITSALRADLTVLD